MLFTYTGGRLVSAALHRFYLLTILVVSLVSLSWAAEIPNPFPTGAIALPPPLPNGVRIVVREDHSMPVVAMQVVVRTGSAAADGVNGIAHYLEHAVFQGTAHFPGPLAPQYALESVGGMSNAVTSRDATRFQGTIAADQVDMLAKVLADVVLSPQLDDAACDRERATIDAEIIHTQENPLTALFDAAYRLTYRTFPYKYSTLGSPDDIARITPAMLRAFHDRWYVPNNLSVVYVGDITVKRATEITQLYFGAAQAAELRASIYADTAPGTVQEIHLNRPIPDTYQVMVFPAPQSSETTAVAATELLASLLTEAPYALLPAAWQGDGVQFGRFGIECVSTRHPGRLLIWAQTSPQMAKKLRQSTMTLLGRLAHTALSSAQISLAKQRLSRQFLFDSATYSQQADLLALHESLGSADTAGRYLSLIQGTTAAQIQASVPSTLLAWVTLGQPPKGQQ